MPILTDLALIPQLNYVLGIYGFLSNYKLVYIFAITVKDGMHDISNYIGIIGVTLVLGAYFFSQTGRVTFESVGYLFSNLFGSLLITFSLIYHWNLSSFLIELAWFSISIMGLIKMFRKWANALPARLE